MQFIIFVLIQIFHVSHAEISVSEILKNIGGLKPCAEFYKTFHFPGLKLDKKFWKLNLEKTKSKNCSLNFSQFFHDINTTQWMEIGECDPNSLCRPRGFRTGETYSLSNASVIREAYPDNYFDEKGRLFLKDGGNDYIRPNYIECCSASPASVKKFLLDSIVGWSYRKSSLKCAAVTYDNLRTPNWIYRDQRVTEDRCHGTDRVRFEDHSPLCYMSFIHSDYVDPRSNATVHRLQIEFGCGCPSTDHLDEFNTSVHVYPNREIYCCKGDECNRELYRFFGFEMLETMVVSLFNKEIENRRRYETILRGNKESEPDVYEFNKRREVSKISHFMLVTFCVVIILVLLTDVENIEDRRVDLSIYNDVLTSSDMKKKEDATLELDGPL